MALGVARAALEMTRGIYQKEGFSADFSKSLENSSAMEAELYRMEADLDAARLMTYKAAWMADNGQANSKEASMCKAKAGRAGNAITLKCVELCGEAGYSEEQLLEKLAHDSKMIDIFEGTQQIQQLIVARQQLGLSSRELKQAGIGVNAPPLVGATCVPRPYQDEGRGGDAAPTAFIKGCCIPG